MADINRSGFGGTAAIATSAALLIGIGATTAGVAGCRPSQPLPFAGFIDAPVAAVAAQVAGRVDSIPVREGDRVQKGQLLAQLDARERQAQLAEARASLAQAKASLEEAEANLQAALPTVKGAGADIARAQATLDEAERNFSRTQEMLEGQSATPQQLDAARARLLEARAALQSLTAGKAVTQGKVGALMAAVSNSRAAVNTSDAAVQLAQVQVAQAQVLCPFDGLVVNRNLEEGEWAAPGTPVVTIEDLGQLWVRLDVEETQLGGLRLGQEAQVKVVAVPGRTFRGHVIEVGAEGEFAVNRDVKRGRPDIRTFRVRIAIDERSEELRPGMTAEVSILSRSNERPPVATGTAR
jgi:multidrug resistance efflux pump